MPHGAGRFNAMINPNKPTIAVGFMLNRLQMIGIDAAPHPAQMI
jgi:hypothetical protein